MAEITEQKNKKQISDHATLIKYVTSQAWALNHDTLLHLCNILERHVAGIKLSPDEIRAATGRDEKQQDVEKCVLTVLANGIGILPVTGVIAKYSSMVNGISTPEGTSIEQLNGEFDKAMADPRVKAIILKIESPGGTMAGMPEFANKVYRSTFVKPVIAYADDFTASAAYWLASQANILYASDAATVGSIGVYTVVVDSSERAKAMGLKFNIVRSGANKGAGTAGVEITQGNIEALQEWIDDSNEAFLSACLRGRREAGLDEKTLRNAADGRVYLAQRALSLKLIDGIKNFDDLINSDLPGLIGTRENVAAAASADNFKVKNLRDKTMANEKTDAPGAGTTAATAAAAERQRINEISAALNIAGLEQVRQKAIDGEWPLEKAKAAAFDEMVKINISTAKDLQEKLDAANKKLAAIAAGGAPESLKGADATDTNTDKQAGEKDNGKAETYQARVDELVTGGAKKAAAFAQAARELPKSQQAWKDSQPRSTVED